MKNLFVIVLSVFVFSSCMKGESADLVIHNAQIHTMVDGEKTFEALAIKNGKIVEIGPERQILNKYSSEEYIDAEQKDVYPGLNDSHGHLFSYAKQKLSVDLVGCESMDELIYRVQKHQSKHQRDFIIGRGWDQSLWEEGDTISNRELNRLFPNTPVMLTRIDGHALLANEALLKKSNAYKKFQQSVLKDGHFEFNSDGTLNGIVVDNAMNPITAIAPPFSRQEIANAILTIQDELFSYGITGVHEAGVTLEQLSILEQLVDEKKLFLDIYAMLIPSEKSIDFAKKNGIYRNNNLLVRSFKVFGDGALGSRGACLKKPYSDMPHHHGYLTTEVEEMERISKVCEETGYQMNTHAIGDSTNKLLLEIYADQKSVNPDHRWRIEHAQVISPNDFELFSSSGAFPSVQPTHAISDQRWAKDRLGKERMKGAYAYNSLLQSHGMLAIGTDFPVEVIDPFRTLHAATNRQDKNNEPVQGFLPNEKITLEDCLKGMTIWSAFASFQEEEIGTIEEGKNATLVIFDRPLTSTSFYQANFAYTVFIKGKKVYSVE